MLVVPLEAVRTETVVLNSRFLASLSPVDSVEEARAFVARIRAEFPDATHHVPAFIVGGGGSSLEFCSDDGEPSGTAGRPLLATLKGSGFGNVAVVVTRWFGGTLLGTGGLVRAYAEAGKAALGRARRAALVEVARAEFELPYGLYERVRALAIAELGVVLEEDFAEAVRLVVELPKDRLTRFSALLAELSSGAIVPRLLGEGRARRPL